MHWLMTFRHSQLNHLVIQIGGGIGQRLLNVRFFQLGKFTL